MSETDERSREEQAAATTPLEQLARDFAGAVALAAPSVVRVDDGSRLTASGVIWESDGVIVAASHAVERDDEVTVVLADGSRYSATLVGRDDDSDLAVLRLEGAADLPAIPRQEDGDAVRVGALALAVTRPGEAGLVATLGLVSRKLETQTDAHPEYILNTDAVLYPGASGGALVDTSGRMIGLINRLFGRGMGVALGTPLVARVVSTLLTHGRMPRGYLGVRTQLVTLPESLRAALGLAQERGLLVANVEAGSAADKGGIFLGDTLVKIGEEALEDVSDLRRHLRAGQEVTITVLRAGQLQSLSLTVGAARE